MSPAGARTPEWAVFASGKALAQALARTVANALSHAIDRRGRAFIAVSGGSTPGRFFDALSTTDIDWTRVTVTLVDERFVDRASPRSNAALVRDRLMTGRAAAARFIDLHAETSTVEKAAQMLDASFAALPWPLDVVVLGMGGDGHTASFFPDAPNLPDLLDAVSTATVLPVHAPSVPEPRLTLSLARLKSAGLAVLHIEGEAKKALITSALMAARPLPVVSTINTMENTARIFWAP